MDSEQSHLAEEGSRGVEHLGIHAKRLPNNPLEGAVFSSWEKRQAEEQLLSYLLGCGNHPVEVSQRDATVAATVIQWLGSPVGQKFLGDVNELTSGAFLKNL